MVVRHEFGHVLRAVVHDKVGWTTMVVGRSIPARLLKLLQPCGAVVVCWVPAREHPVVGTTAQNAGNPEGPLCGGMRIASQKELYGPAFEFI